MEKTIWETEYQRWLDSPAISEEEWKELNTLRDNVEEVQSRFSGALEFGTAGLRGIMGSGTARMNVHVIRWATQAFAQLIVAEGEDACRRGVCIAYDCRLHSEEFAREAACVCAANGIHVRLFESLRPTPELSFVVLHYKAIAGINITASHNPWQCNGYKVYWSDGAQLPPQHAAEVASNMDRMDLFADVMTVPYAEALEQGKIELLGEKTDQLFLKECLAQTIDRASVEAVSDTFKIVYTPFHGCGHRLVPEGLKRLGVRHVLPVAEQMIIDGNFPTVESPNPENPEGFYLAVDLAKKEKADLIIGTDPDSDRVGIMVPGKDGEYHTLTGNQVGVLLMDYIIGARQRTGTMPEKPAMLSTIVSTGMAKAVCEANGIHYEQTFTGFKFMAEKLAEYKKDGSYNYLLAFEESYGYMVGDFVRDKDAVTASLLIAEMAAWYSRQNMSLLDAMEKLYERYGWFAEKTVNLVMEGLDGAARMKALMESLRKDPPERIAERAVLRMKDYATGKILVPSLGTVGQTPMSGSNVLCFELEDGTDFIVRPSGTEPKIKVYVLAKGTDKNECRNAMEACTIWASELAR